MAERARLWPSAAWRACAWARAVALALLALLALLAGDCAGDEAPAAIEMAASPAQVSVGTAVTVTITYRWKRSWSCAHDPDPSSSFQDLFVTSISPPASTLAGTLQSRAFTLTVLPTRSGVWTLPQPTLTVEAPNQKPFQATAPAVLVTVGRARSDLAAPPPRPFAVRPPEPVKHPVWWLAACAAGAIAAALVVMLLLLRRQRETARVQSAHELLQETLQRALLSTDGKEAAALTSLSLRRFAGTIWSFDGPGSTAREAIQLVRRAGTQEEGREFSRLLEELEAMRWAPDALAAQQLQPTIAAAQHWGRRLHERMLAEAAERERGQVPAGAPAPTGVPS